MSRVMPFNVAILDDSLFFLKLMLKALKKEKEINSHPFWENIDIRMYSSVADFELNEFYRPDVAIVDYYLDESNGLQLIESMQLRQNDCRVLLISSEQNVPQKISYIERGSPMFLSKLDPHFFDKIRVFVEEAYYAARTEKK